MSEKIRKLVRDLAGQDMPADVIARVFNAAASEGGGVKLDDIWESWDTGEVFKYAEGWEEDDVDRVFWEEEGENDGPEWAALCRLKDGRWGFVHAGCDYTGWG